MFYFKKIFQLISSENWRIFLFGWIRVVILKRKFYSQKYKNLIFKFPDPLVFLWQFKEIYIDECYDLDSKKPKILIDCGANIGLCSLYWANKFPDSTIFAIEADPQVAKILQGNLEINNVKNVTIINKAAWINDGHIEFSLGPIDGGAISKSRASSSVKVACFNFALWVDSFEVIDYLKIDIEGAEKDVVPSLTNETLQKVGRAFVEYHQPANELSKIGKIISHLEDAGFSCFVSKVILAPKNLNIGQFESGNSFIAQCNIHGAKSKILQK